MCFIFWPLIRKEHTVVDYFYFSAFGAPWSRIRRLTSFCSSIKKARTIFSRTALWLKTPPYALKTFFLRRDSLFNQKGADNLLTNSFVAQNTSVCSEDLLFAKRQPLSFSGSARFDTLQLNAGHGTFWKGWPFLEVLEHQFTTGCAYLLPTIRLGVVRQSSSVGNTLNHLSFRKFDLLKKNSKGKRKLISCQL